jgi:hypothetical protein
MTKMKTETRYSVVEVSYNIRSRLDYSDTSNYKRPGVAFKTKVKAQNEWKRLSRDWYIIRNINSVVDTLDDLMDERTYKIIEHESSPAMIHAEHQLPGLCDRLDEHSNKAWRTAWSYLPSPLQFRLVKEFNILPYEVIEIEVEV